MNFDRLFSKIIKFSLSLLIIFFGVNPVFAGANVATKGVGDEVPSYVRSDITGFDFHGEDLHLSSIAGAVARDADFSNVDLHGTVVTLADLKGSNLNGIDLTDTLSDPVEYDINYYGNLNILTKIFKMNKLDINNSTNLCVIRLK